MPHVTAIVLAAGASTRMGDENKLLLPFRGKPLLSAAVEAVCASSVDDVVVVTGHEDRQIRDVLDSYPIRVAYNPEYAAGVATSIRRGLIACPPETDGFAVCLGDMPFITEHTISRLHRSFLEQGEASIVVAVSRGRRTYPVIIHQAFRDELMQLSGDSDLGPVLDAHPEVVAEMDVGTEGVTVDTPEAYEEVRNL